jgi:class 3 adenylate cyclase
LLRRRTAGRGPGAGDAYTVRIASPLLTMPDTESTLTVLFADVAGSTRLYELAGDAAALATIEHCLSLAENLARGHGGRLVKTIGDEAMLVFATADGAAATANDIQTRMTGLPATAGVRVAFRIGMHSGQAIERDGDVFGDSVNVAARMVAFAKRGQVMLSEAAAEALSPWLRRRLREVDLLTVKGKERDIRVFELLWQDATDEVTAVVTRGPVRVARLALGHGTREILLDERTTTLTLGRDPQNDVVIADRLASRLHGRIERRRDKFVLVDQSSNGTWVTLEGEREIELHREELLLRGRGSISFGHPYAADPTETLAFVSVEGGA